MKHLHLAIAAVILCGSLAPTAAAADADAAAQPQAAEPMAQAFLVSGKLSEGEAALADHLQANPSDDQARFGLGTIQFLHGVERLMQSLYAYGVRTQSGAAGGLPYFRLPIPENPSAKTLSYEQARQVIATWNADLAAAEQTLAQVKSADVKLPLKFGLIRLDFDGDGTAGHDEALWRIYDATMGGGWGDVATAQAAEQFVIAFDAGDVQWLRGYCHMLMAVNEMILAYDQSELFDSAGHLFFRKVDSPYPFLAEGSKIFDIGGDVDIVDAVAAVHLMRFPLKEPQRTTAALEHLRAVIRQSRESWKLILAETDDENEWIPNSRQASVVSGVRVSDELIDRWTQFLDEADALLAGKTLAPFWRGTGRQGVNLNKVFTDPRPLDLVLWVQGSAAAPYLQDGTITNPNAWRDIWNAFGRESFIGFAIWFN